MWCPEKAEVLEIDAPYTWSRKQAEPGEVGWNVRW